jgi:hypothetical protein
MDEVVAIVSKSKKGKDCFGPWRASGEKRRGEVVVCVAK